MSHDLRSDLRFDHGGGQLLGLWSHIKVASRILSQNKESGLRSRYIIEFGCLGRGVRI